MTELSLLLRVTWKKIIMFNGHLIVSCYGKRGGLYFDNAMLAPGCYRGIEVVGNKLYAINSPVGNHGKSIIEVFDITNMSRLAFCSKYCIDDPHDLYYYDNRLFIISTNDTTCNKIYIIDSRTLEMLDVIEFLPSVHLNSIIYYHGRYYGTIFKLDNNFDKRTGGKILDITNLVEKGDKSIDIVIDGLWQPHSLNYIDNRLLVLDSLRCQILIWCPNRCTLDLFADLGTGKFIRGIAFDGNNYYIGSSRSGERDCSDLGIKFNSFSGVIILDKSGRIVDTFEIDTENVYDIEVM